MLRMEKVRKGREEVFFMTRLHLKGMQGHIISPSSVPSTCAKPTHTRLWLRPLPSTGIGLVTLRLANPRGALG
jgi:hypothetical protein